jgi:hypothetical protein
MSKQFTEYLVEQFEQRGVQRLQKTNEKRRHRQTSNVDRSIDRVTWRSATGTLALGRLTRSCTGVVAC